MKKINILLVGFNLDGAMGDNYYQLSKSLIKFKEHNWFGLSKRDKRINIKNANFKEVLLVDYNKRNIISLFKNIFKINKFIKSNKIDIIFLITPNLIFNVFISIAFKKKKIIYFLHDPTPHSGEKFLRRYTLNMQNKIVTSLSQIIVVASYSQMKEIRNSNILNLNKKRIETIELGLLNNLVFSELNKKNTDIVEDIDVLFFGRIEHYKGLDILADALEFLETQKKKVKCYIVGKGKIIDFIKSSQIDLFEINNTYVEDYELASLIKRAKIVVFPYKNATGTQTVQTVYFYQKPVIASNTGSFSDYIIDGETGILFEKNDYKELAKSIDYLLENEKTRRIMGSNGKNLLSERFNMDIVAKKYIRLFEEN
ncbi:glycosyltransferase family 4 protein [Heyndrickxia coagulans]|uniref:Glycosyltransferase, group 1 family protein n=1 Tax=Heyndrickxia coagulans TaxID=1398 RepID=A0A133KZW0_HEYCO|nr:glycosyltransferase family 4 protein [Heyndrickxia coagulans]KWZ85249.1 glycosyltransferase, group 1 family protein [Heyndrickxia coagulans]